MRGWFRGVAYPHFCSFSSRTAVTVRRGGMLVRRGRGLETSHRAATSRDEPRRVKSYGQNVGVRKRDGSPITEIPWVVNEGLDALFHSCFLPSHTRAASFSHTFHRIVLRQNFNTTRHQNSIEIISPATLKLCRSNCFVLEPMMFRVKLYFFAVFTLFELTFIGA